jgi:hypothetical protein
VTRLVFFKNKQFGNSKVIKILNNSCVRSIIKFKKKKLFNSAADIIKKKTMSIFTFFFNLHIKKSYYKTKFYTMLLFLPDNIFFFKNTLLQLSDQYTKYTNIMPLQIINLKLKFKQKKFGKYQNNSILLWYLLNYCENKFNKPFLMKMLYSRSISKKHNLKQIMIQLFAKYRRNSYRFKKNFYLGEIIRILFLAILTKDPTLFMN